MALIPACGMLMRRWEEEELLVVGFDVSGIVEDRPRAMLSLCEKKVWEDLRSLLQMLSM